MVCRSAYAKEAPPCPIVLATYSAFSVTLVHVNVALLPQIALPITMPLAGIVTLAVNGSAVDVPVALAADAAPVTAHTMIEQAALFDENVATTSPVVPDGTSACQSSLIPSPTIFETTEDALTPPTVTELSVTPPYPCAHTPTTIFLSEVAVPIAAAENVKVVVVLTTEELSV